MGSLKVNASEMFVAEYVLFFGETTVMVGGVVSSGGDAGADRTKIWRGGESVEAATAKEADFPPQGSSTRIVHSAD